MWEACAMRKPFTAAIALMLAACSVGPGYERPPAPVPAAYKEAGYGKPDGEWNPAAPQDDANRGPWWHVYNDPVLDELMEEIDVSNQNLKAVEAAYRQASGIVRQARAGYFPTVDL